MKFIIALLVLGSTHAFACSPALPATAQLISLDHIINSPAFSEQLSMAQSQDIQVRITNMDATGSAVALSNGCAILSKLIYKPVSHPGMCPRIDTVVSETICQ